MDALVNQYEEENNSKSWYFTMLFCFYTWKLKICAKKIAKNNIFQSITCDTSTKLSSAMETDYDIQNGFNDDHMTFRTVLMMIRNGI